MRCRATYLCLLASLAFAGTAFAGTMSGVVYDDSNGNGTRDAGERGIDGIKLSNGRDIVRSDADGAYAIESRADAVVFVIKPAGYRFARRDDGLPDAWVQGPVGQATSHDFALQSQAFPPRRADGLSVLVLADSQVSSLVEVDDFHDDIIESIKRDSAIPLADLGLTLGDLVNDDLSLYPVLNAVTTSLGVPWMHIAGNHDLDAGATDDAASLRTFRATYGPDTVAWEEPEAVFVGLDDVIAMPGSKPAYVGGLRADQFAFLEAYLPTVDRDRLLVLGAHIPFFQLRAADRERLFALLHDFPHVLLLSGHTHRQMHVFHDADDGWHGAQPLHEYNVGAACGAFWSGVEDADGIPDATMADGTPNGHARLQVRAGGEYALTWHVARDRANSAIGLHAPKVLRRGAYPAFAVYANVYMGMDDSVVEYRIDDAPWQPMHKVLQPDPRVLAENMRDDEATELRGWDRSPEAVPSQHLWRGTLPTDLAVGEHAIEVRYNDPWRGEQSATTTYRLSETTP